MNHYNFFPGDYLKDTLDLSWLEDCAYRRLLDHYYSTEQGISDEAKFRVTRAASKAEREATQRVLDRFFKRVLGTWMHTKVEREIMRALPAVEAARQNGRKGGRPRGKKPTGLQEENPLGSEIGTQKEPKENPAPKLPDPPPVPREDDDSPLPPIVPPPNGGKIPCPPLLSLTEAQRQQLNNMGIPYDALERWTPVARARLVTMDPMPLGSWQRALATTITRDWGTRRDEVLGKVPARRGQRGPVQPSSGQSTTDFLRGIGFSDEEVTQTGLQEAGAE